MSRRAFVLSAFVSILLRAQAKLPEPAKADLPYLLHAEELIPTEAVEAKPQEGKDGVTYTVPGPTSSAKTPLASPIFLMKSAKLDPSKLQVYAWQVNGRNRQIVFPKKKKGPEPFTLTVKPLGPNTWRLEVDRSLPNGEYALSASDSNQAFCFAVY